MPKRLHRILFYGGLDKATYVKYEPYFLEKDMINLRFYLAVTAVGFLIIGVVGIFMQRISEINTILYLLTAAAMLIMLCVQQSILQLKRDITKLEEALVYIFMILIYLESIVLTVQHPDLPAVTYLGAVLMIPLLFSRRPLSLIILQSLLTVLFCILVHAYKLPDIAFLDTWNAITFLVISVAAITIVVPMRINSMAQSRIIKEMSEYDRLTGVKNRNSYEADCLKLAEEKQYIVVVYADANGLHEINNTKGHAAGDLLLKATADILKNHFGKERTYRIGGDEFVVIYPDASLTRIGELIKSARKEIADRGYSVAFGYAISTSPQEELDSVCKRAEAGMYLEKSEYYKQAGLDGRRQRGERQ